MKNSKREEIVSHSAKKLFNIVLDIQSYPEYIPWCTKMVVNEKKSDEKRNIDVHLAEVSLSPYHIQDYEDCGEDKVEKVTLYGTILELLNKFVSIHFHPEEFKKRKRDKKNIDENIHRGGDQRLKKNYYN